MALVRDYDRNRRWVRIFMVKAGEPGQPQKPIWERSIRDRYGDPGTPVMRTLPNGAVVVRQSGDTIFLAGAGASPKGELPFLDRFDLKTLKAERLFHSAEGTFEQVVDLISADGSRFITRYKTPTDPPNHFLLSAAATPHKPPTIFP